MGIVERREREKEEVRRKIMDAARDLFATEGYEKVTMRRIADAIEYSPTTIYHHFEDKDDLVNALCEEDFARLLAVFKSQLPPEDPLEWIRQLGRGYARFAIENPNHYRFMFMTRAKFERVPEPSDSGQQSFAVIKAAVEQAIALGRFRRGDAQEMAQVLWAGVHGVVALLITLQCEHWPQGAPSDNLVDAMIENGIRGFLKTPSEG
jgi:AcrR family transcriptional regulator